MVMFAGIQSALDDQNQPRKTDVLLQPGVQQTTQPQGGQVDSQPATPTSTAIDTNQQSAAGPAPKSPQAQRSPQQVLDANSNVEIGNQAATTAKQNADKIAANQQTEIAKYQPVATTNLSDTQKYVNDGGTAPTKQTFDATPAPIADTTALDSTAQSFSANPFSGITNALDKALALKSGTYTQQANDAQQGIAADRLAVNTAAADAGTRLKTAQDASTADDAAIAPWLAQQQAQSGQLAAQDAQAVKDKLAVEQRNERAAALADYNQQVAAYQAQAKAQGVAINPTGGPVYGQETYADFKDPNAFLSTDDYGRLNRILGLQGQPTLAAQPQVNQANLYQNQYSPDATKAALEKLYQQALADKPPPAPAERVLAPDSTISQTAPQIATPQGNKNKTFLDTLKDFF